MSHTHRLLLFFLLSLATTLGLQAQRLVIAGKVSDQKTKNPVEYASVALLRTDSTVVTGTTTADDGTFSLRAKEVGSYLLRLTYVGYQPAFTRVTLTEQNDSISLPNLLMSTNDNVLREATVSVTAARVEQKDDTTMFNAAAYRVPAGSTLEALIKQLPGVDVQDDGTIKWNGKTVSEFLINGKDFFKGDTQTAMKNLPTDMVSKIKAYDKKSDYTMQTGIDDGEETTVLDIATKRELNQSWVANADVAYGTHDRYSARAFATRFTDRTRVTAFGAMNNVNDAGFGGPRGFGGSSGLVATKNAGVDFSWENGKEKREAGRLELGGNVRYNHRSSDAITRSNSETFLASGGSSSFANARNFSGNHSTSVNSSFRVEWQIDSMTNLTFRPQYSYSESRNSGTSLSATFSADPYALPGMISPLDSIFAESAMLSNPELYALMVNTNNRLSLGNSKTHNVSANLNLVRRFGSRGRNLSLRLRGGYSKSESHSFSISKINYSPASGKAPGFLNQYSTTPSKTYEYSARLGYVEPLWGKWFGEVRYQFSYKYQDSNRSRYNLDSLAYDPYRTLFPEYADYGNPDAYPIIGSLPTRDDVLNHVRDLNNSQYADYKYLDHTATVGLRYNTSDITFNAGVDFNPERTKMAYNRPGQHIDTLIVRDVFKVSPQVRFRYKFSKTKQLDIRYRGSSSQPAMTDLLAVVDDSDPLHISMGNPGLKPSWNNTLNVLYNGYVPASQTGLMVGMRWNQVSNSVANRMVYDEATGVRYTRPENIDGKWSTNGIIVFNTGLGKKKLFTISTHTNIDYSHDVGYVSRMTNPATNPAQSLSLFGVPQFAALATAEPAAERTYDYYNAVFQQAASQKNTTRTFNVGENLSANYRYSWFDFGLQGRLNYQHARASVQENANLDTWNFAYGANLNVTLNCGLSISTDIRMNSRRGYSDASMNTNELLWNAQIAQSFLKNRAATISVQFYDILQQQSNISRTLSATQRSDTWSNAINSYIMVHFIYKFSAFAGGKSEEKQFQRFEGRPGPPDMRGRGGMPAMRMGR